MTKRLAWLMLFGGFASMAWLDPWSLGERDPAALADGARMAVRHAHIGVLRMAFLFLALVALFDQMPFEAGPRRRSMIVIGAGVVAYVAGQILIFVWSGWGWLIPLGALMNLVGFATLAQASHRQHADWQLTAILSVVTCGMALDIAMSLMAVSPMTFLPTYLETWDSARMRMLRLAQVAVIALAVIALAYYMSSPRPQTAMVRYGQWALTVGAIGMPLILTAAGFTWLGFKYLLSVPAWAVIGGVGAGAWGAYKAHQPFKLFGWTLVGVSLLVGMGMGTYAFDGPFDSPAIVGDYNDLPRRLLRLGHAYAIVFGLLVLFSATDRRTTTRIDMWRLPTLVVGSVLSLTVIGLLAADWVSPRALWMGPAVVALFTLLSAGAAGQGLPHSDRSGAFRQMKE